MPAPDQVLDDHPLSMHVVLECGLQIGEIFLSPGPATPPNFSLKMEIRYSLLLIMAVLIKLSNADREEDMSNLFKNERKTYCGKHLAETLSTMCHGIYNTFYKKDIYKKSFWPPREESRILVKRETAQSLLANYNGRRKKRGVYNECCQKSCTPDELVTYCGMPRFRRSALFNP